MGCSIGCSNVEFGVISGAELGDHRLGIELSGTSSGAAVEDRVNLQPSKFGVIDKIGEAERAKAIGQLLEVRKRRGIPYLPHR